MNLAQKIREAWRDADGFATIIPLENISTQRSVCDSLPYGIIHPTETTVGTLTNSGPKIRTWKATVEFHVPTLPAANVIQEEAEIIFCATLASHGLIDSPFVNGTRYWATSGGNLAYSNNGTIGNFDYTYDRGTVSIRCIYDLWYWGDDPVVTPNNYQVMFSE